MNFKVSGGNKGAKITLKQESRDGVEYTTVHIVLAEPAVPEKIVLSDSFPSIDCHSTWSPSVRYGRSLQPNWYAQKTEARLAHWMPLHQIISKSGNNRFCVALSDTALPTSIATGVLEKSANLDCRIELFTTPVSEIKEYTVTVRVDTRDIKYYDSIYDAVNWWESDCGYTPAAVPDAARQPVDSLWYSFHQDLNADEIVKECALSKAVGMDTVIVDDGWQTDDTSLGYAYCGDWEAAPSKVGDMKQLVDRVHETGMKFMLWYSVPFVGIHSKKYKQFQSMILNGNLSNLGCYALDPRYKEVRDYLTGVYVEAVKNWGLDGLKLDFIDRFELSDESIKPDPRRDYTSLEEAVDALMSDIHEKLTAINPDILIEFRQTYIGPSVRKYGNMLRVTDCPSDAFKNRVDTVNLRLTSGKTAVHSDMLMWHYDDTVEGAALQLTSTLYSVPQISVRVDKLNEDHYKMLKFYLDFWKQHREILLDGKLTADNPEDNYSTVCATLGESSVITAYSNSVVEVKTKNWVAVNATGGQSLVIKGASGNYRVVDCKGNVVGGGVADSLCEVEVPTAGMIVVE